MTDERKKKGDQLEHYVARLVEAGGFDGRPKSTKETPGGQVDLMVRIPRGPNKLGDDRDVETLVVECKNQQDALSREQLRTLLARCEELRRTAEGTVHGIFVTRRVAAKAARGPSAMAKDYGRWFWVDSVTEFEQRWVSYGAHIRSRFAGSHRHAHHPLRVELLEMINDDGPGLRVLELESSQDDLFEDIEDSCADLGRWLLEDCAVDGSAGAYDELPLENPTRAARAPVVLRLDGNVRDDLHSLARRAMPPFYPIDDTIHGRVFDHLVKIGRIFLIVDARHDPSGLQLQSIFHEIGGLFWNVSPTEGAAPLCPWRVLVIARPWAVRQSWEEKGEYDPAALVGCVPRKGPHHQIWEPRCRSVPTMKGAAEANKRTALRKQEAVRRAAHVLRAEMPEARVEELDAALRVLAFRSLSAPFGLLTPLEAAAIFAYRVVDGGFKEALRAVRALTRGRDGLFRLVGEWPRELAAEAQHPSLAMEFSDSTIRNELAADRLLSAIEAKEAIESPINEHVRELVVHKAAECSLENDGDEEGYIRIPAGPCIVGGSYWNDTPLRVTFVGEIWIQRFPVRRSDFEERAARGTSSERLGTHPAQLVSLEDATEFADRIGRERGIRARLPTAVEWEKAARGPYGSLFPWGERWDWPDNGGSIGADGRRADIVLQEEGAIWPVGEVPDWRRRRCNTRPFVRPLQRLEEQPPEGAVHVGTVPVDTFAEVGKSTYGVVDMVGNVWEWTTTPAPLAPDRRQIKGGSYDYRVGIPYPSRWNTVAGNKGSNGVGFRLVRDN